MADDDAPTTPVTDSDRESAHAELEKFFKRLASISFDTASDIEHYTRKVRDISKKFSVELEFAAQDLEARLRAVPPATSEETGVVIARKAAKVAKHLRQAAREARQMGGAASRTWGSLKTNFADQMGARVRSKPKKTIKLDA
ncbi:hypothetical protein [Nocardiopsis tropica]|uniref:Uncharacterized protein n=1 Tax=Nocardiopsis tropica TaxID=109330 RepID=A0ABU7L1Q8_9ACTN|nr:hypothetical protein [Nocardiopsis umidischolae]MEE2055474.1 hypothetical protein [Nocardiopsis umidischolae]